MLLAAMQVPHGHRQHYGAPFDDSISFFLLPLDEIPLLVFVRVFYYLSMSQLLQVGLVCKKFYQYTFPLPIVQPCMTFSGMIYAKETIFFPLWVHNLAGA